MTPHLPGCDHYPRGMMGSHLVIRRQCSCLASAVDDRDARIAALTATLEESVPISDLEHALQRLGALTADLVAAKNQLATQREFLDTIHEHVALACEALGLNRTEHMCDSWTLVERAGEEARKLAAEKERTRKLVEVLPKCPCGARATRAVDFDLTGLRCDDLDCDPGYGDSHGGSYVEADFTDLPWAALLRERER